MIGLAIERTDCGISWAEKAWSKLEQKIRAECLRVGSGLTFIPVEGRYRDCMMPSGLWWWSNGFWPGLLWQAYHATGCEEYHSAARGASQRLMETFSQPEKLDHDVGFMFLHSAVAQFRLTGDQNARTSALKAADLLAGRLNENGGFLQAWDKSPWMEDSSG